ncbi:hypothetical protein NL676_027683 [Syzygium grande]|nr:hypothetical protein NL676_027683 [Syzygium grande]
MYLDALRINVVPSFLPPLPKHPTASTLPPRVLRPGEPTGNATACSRSSRRPPPPTATGSVRARARPIARNRVRVHPPPPPSLPHQPVSVNNIRPSSFSLKAHPSIVLGSFQFPILEAISEEKSHLYMEATAAASSTNRQPRLRFFRCALFRNCCRCFCCCYTYP